MIAFFEETPFKFPFKKNAVKQWILLLILSLLIIMRVR